MMEVVAGSWGDSGRASVAKTFRGKLRYVSMPAGWFRREKVFARDLVSVDLATQERLVLFGRKFGAGLAGGVLLGPLGALAGLLAGGNKTTVGVVLEHRDGRRAVIKCAPDESHDLLGAAIGSAADQRDAGQTKWYDALWQMAFVGAFVIGGLWLLYGRKPAAGITPPNQPREHGENSPQPAERTQKQLGTLASLLAHDPELGESAPLGSLTADLLTKLESGESVFLPAGSLIAIKSRLPSGSVKAWVVDSDPPGLVLLSPTQYQLIGKPR